MALKYAVKSGNWSGTDVWGIKLTGTVTFTNGSTAVTGSGTAFTTELSAGDKIFGADGVWYEVASITDDTNLTLTVAYGGASASDVTTYKQTTAPGEGDNATINASVEVSLDAESGTVTVGDDTGTALDVYGTLKRSNAATSSLVFRLKGHFYVRNGGYVEIGSSSAPISKSYPVTIELNYSASLSDEKYSWLIESGGNVVLQGQSYTIATTLTADVASGATDVYVSDLVGWLVGDDVVLEESEDTGWVYSTFKADSSTISAIDTNTNMITLSSATNYLHRQGFYVYNLSCAVTVKAYQEGYRCKMIFYDGASADIDFVRFNFFGDDSYFYNTIDGYSVQTRYGGLSIRSTGVSIDNIVVYKGEYTALSCLAQYTSYTNWYFFNATGEAKTKGVSISNLFLIGIEPNGSTFNFSGVTDTYASNVRQVSTAGGQFTAPRVLEGFKSYYNCKLYWSGDRSTCACWTEGVEFSLSNIEIKYGKHGIQVGYGTKVFVESLVFDGVDTAVRIRSGGRIYGDDLTAYDISYSNYFYPYSGIVTNSSGKNRVPEGTFGRGSAYLVTGRGGTGECLVLDPSFSDVFLYVLDIAGDVSFTSFPVNSGKTITLSFWVKVSTSGFDGDLQIAAEGCGINYTWTSVDLTEADSDWVQRSFTLGTTTDKGFVRLKIRAKDGATVSGDIYLDDFAITES